MIIMDNICLNCNTKTENNFCSICGQKTSTHRFSLKHFFVHDMIHGIFHLDKGFLFTLKELFTRPGHSIREYVQGKRVKHFNAFTALIIIIGLGYFLGDYIRDQTIDIALKDKEYEGFYRVAKDYIKIIALVWVPFYAFASFVIFIKSKQNYSENLVLNMYMVVGIFFIEFIFFIAIFPFTVGYNYEIATAFLTLIKWVFYFWFFYQYFSTFYKKWHLALRVIIMVVAIIIITKIIDKIVNEIGLMYFH